MFVDRVVIWVRGGKGGDGCRSFRREKYVPRGGPDGGDGGDGGDVIIRAVAGADTLAGLSHQRHWVGEAGQRGGPANCTGKMGRAVYIDVPPGTLVIDADRGHTLRDLVEPGEQVVVARGGKGGRGNRSFATATNRAPRQFTLGELGEERRLILELKVIADCGLVGLPNAGKSTLLSRLSRAHPEIADYPFTTKYPNLGHVWVGHDNYFILADLPGLIEGASRGVGLGHEFLRHVERTRVLVHLVEPFPLDGSDPLRNYRTIRSELEQYSPELARKPELLAVSKCELTGSEQVVARLQRELDRPVIALSAATGAGLWQLTTTIAEELTQLRRLDRLPDEPTTDRPIPPHLNPLLASLGPADSRSANDPRDDLRADG